ncbi:ATP-binding protein [Streptomyces gilvus]|uniref:ATP-binding protein n=1 Tax=Streptomyces gilvus TaxID=2920937 RepID=UPI001F0E3263|nr:ATP-binding protein [Streptomyces sp. CME 23]MCH5670788.1 ATP-binding protein [Streptomyces sp. CME 23]
MRIAHLRRADRVAGRLGLAFGLLALLVALCGAGAMTGALLLEGIQHRITDRLDPTEDDNLRLLDAGVSAQRSMRGYLITGEQSELAAFRAARARIPLLLSDIRAHDVADERAVAAQQRQVEAYLRVAERQARAAPRSAGAAALTREASLRFNAFEHANGTLTDQLTADEQRQQERADTVTRAGLAGLGALVAVAVAGAVYTSMRTTRALTRPLLSTERTLGRLAAGEHSARAEVTGPREIRAVARSVNELAEEADRLRAVEEERRQLSGMAREAGIRIRAKLDVDHVLDAACTGVGEGLDADHVFVLLAEEGGGTVPVARAWSACRGLLPAGEQPIPPVPLEVVHDHYRRGTSWCLNGPAALLSEGGPLPGGPGSFGASGLPPQARAAAKKLGLACVVVIPIGVGEQAMGALFLARTRPERPWRPVEIEIAESMAAGVGRALHTALLYEQESRLVEKLRALDQAKSDFLSTVSHELRTPLTSIVGCVELLQDEDTGPLTPTQAHMLDVVDRNAQRLRALIEDLLTLSRIESGVFITRKAPVDLRRLVVAAADAIRPSAEAASVSLRTRCPQQPLILEADGEQLDRVLMNLLSNAVKFTPDGGTVTVCADVQDGTVVLSVSDTGIGIPAAEQDKLFQRFFRASNAADAAIPGTGLGLTIVRTIVANHGGGTEVHSEEGRGTTITARLPLVGGDRSADTDTT